MDFLADVKLSQNEVFNLLCRFDDSSDLPLQEGLDFNTYSEKLSKCAFFVLAYEASQTKFPQITECVGFIAYYINNVSNIIYIPQVVVYKDNRHQGIGTSMFNKLYSCYNDDCFKIKLEVLKDNQKARGFYEREGFVYEEEHDERIFMCKEL